MNPSPPFLMRSLMKPRDPIYEAQLRMIRPENQIFTAQLCVAWFSALPELSEYIETQRLLHPKEQEYAAGLKFEKRRKSYLLGRLTAKRALVALLGAAAPETFYIQSGIFTQPVVVGTTNNTQVSITHTDDFGAALAFPEAHPMGIDLEVVSTGRNDALERYLTPAEKEQILGWPYTYEAGLTLIWTAKEAISKVFKTGLMASLEIFETTRWEVHENYVLSFYKNFHQYKVISFMVGHCMCSVAYPLKTELDFQITPLQRHYGEGNGLMPEA